MSSASLVAALLFSALCLAETSVTIVSANLTSGNQQSYDEGHGMRILKTLAPDVALIQEFNYRDGSPVAIRAFVDETFGKEFHYVREKFKQEEEGGIPNGIVSRFPILEWGEIDDPTQRNRDIVWARLDIPGKRKLVVFSVHLGATEHKREDAARALVKAAPNVIKEGDYWVIGGDLNTEHRGETTLKTLSEIVSDKNIPVDESGNPATSSGRRKHYDAVLPSQELDAYNACVNLAGKLFPRGAVVDTRVFSNLKALPGVQKMDSGSTNMQHMAVIKRFEIPVAK